MASTCVEKVEAYIRGLVADNPVLQKIRAGEDISAAEIQEIAYLLAGQDPYVTEDLLRKVYDHKAARFIQFIRHILGLQKLKSWPQAESKWCKVISGRQLNRTSTTEGPDPTEV